MMTSINDIAKQSTSVTQEELIQGAFDIFSPCVANTAVTSVTESILYPIDSNHSPIEFRILGRGNHYIEPFSIYLSYQCRIVNNDATNSDITDADEVGFVDALGQTMFNKIEMEIDNQFFSELTSSRASYKGFISMIRNIDRKKANYSELLRYEPDDLDAIAVQGKVPTAAVAIDEVNDPLLIQGLKKFLNEVRTKATQNKGFEKRMEICSESKWFSCITFPEVDLLNTASYLPPGKNITFKFYKANDDFLTISHKLPPAGNAATAFKRYKVEIRNAKLHVRFVTLHQDITNDHLLKWNRNEYSKHLFKRREILTSSCPVGTINYNMPSVLPGPLPKSILVFIVQSSAMNGKVMNTFFNPNLYTTVCDNKKLSNFFHLDISESFLF